MTFNTFDLIDTTQKIDTSDSYDRFHRRRTSVFYTVATIIEVKENDGFEFLKVCSVRNESVPEIDTATFFFCVKTKNRRKYFRCILTSSCSRWVFDSWTEVNQDEAYRIIPKVTLFPTI
jgi:hypothetical protein